MTSPLDRRRHLTGMAFITPTMAVIIAILVYPILQSIVLSFGQSSIDGSEPYSFVGLKHYATLAGNERFWNSLWVTLVFTGLSIPLELAMTLLAFVWYIRATKGPVGPPLVLIGAMLLLQAITWFAPEPTVMSVWLPITALVAFAILTMLATWVGRTRWHKRQTGLAVASARG